MGILRSVGRGLGFAAFAPGLLLTCWLANLVVAMPAAWLLYDELETAIGSGLAHQRLEQGFDADWYAEIAADPRGLLATFGPGIVGAAAVFRNLEAWWTGGMFTAWPGLVALGGFYALVWAFLLGGILERAARPDRRQSRETFFAACGRCFGRYVQLAVVAGVLYYLVYRLGRWLFGRIEDAGRDVGSERTLLYQVLAGAALVVILLCIVRMIFDYAKIAIALDDRQSAPEALGNALLFVAQNLRRVLGVYAWLGFCWLAVVALYARFAPGAEQSTPVAVLLAFLAGQLYLAGRIFVRLALLGAQTELFQNGRRRGRVALGV